MARTVWTDWSDSISICMSHGGMQGIDMVTGGPEVELTPNPASGEVTVRCGERMELLELFNAAGDKVYNFQLQTSYFQLPPSPPAPTWSASPPSKA